MSDRVLDIILEQNDVTWQTIIYDLIKADEMHPWDIDVSLLTQRYIETIKKLEEMNFFVSGKVLFAAAFLLKLKTEYLVDSDIAYFDSILFPQTEMFDDMDLPFQRQKLDLPPLGIRTPMPRKRKVSVQDLMKALERALEVNKRRIIKFNRYYTENVPVMPDKKVDIVEMIKNIYEKVFGMFQRKETITFSKLLPEGDVTKKEKVYTLLPLLHLENEQKVELSQERQFEEIFISLKAEHKAEEQKAAEPVAPAA